MKNRKKTENINAKLLKYNAEIERNIMEDRKQIENISTNEYVIRRPLYWPIFLLIMFLITLLTCFLEPTSTEAKYLSDIDIIAASFYSLAGFSFWILVSVITFVLLAINFYIYFRFKLVIHGQSFSITPLFEATHDVAFSSVEKVTHVKSFNKKGCYIDILYDNKKIHIPYTLNMKGTFKQKSIHILLENFETHKTNITDK